MTYQKLSFIFILLFSIFVTGCGQDDREVHSSPSVAVSDIRDEEKGRKLENIPTCVETSLPLQRCFKSLEDYGAWKQCVKIGNDRVKCYLEQYPTAKKPRPEPPEGVEGGVVDFAGLPGPYPEGNHFQFDYIVRELTSEEVEYLRDWRDIVALVDSQPCRFVGVLEDILPNGTTRPTSHDELDLDVSIGYDPGDNVYDAAFDVRGDSPDCESDKASRFWMDFLQLRPIDQWLYPVFSPLQVPNVRVGGNNYVLDDKDMYVRVRWENYSGGIATGRFEFIAALADESGDVVNTGDTKTYVVGYYGHFSLPEGQ